MGSPIDIPTVSSKLNLHVPPAMPPVSARMVADALVSDQIIVLVMAAAAPRAGLGEISPVRAGGVAVRIRYADLTNSPPPPADVRLGGPQGQRGGDDA